MKKLLVLCCAIFMAGITHAQLLNAGFESWDTSMTQTLYPRGWQSLTDGYCRQSAGHSGNYAVTVCIWYYYTKTNAVQKQAINFKPSSFDGYYTYTENYVRALGSQDTLIDTAVAAVYLTKWNVALQRADTVGMGILPLQQATGYTHFSCPVSYSSADAPDSVTVVLDPSLVRRYIDQTYYQTPSPSGYGSFLTVDDVSLQAPTAVTQPHEHAISIYPNPANNTLTITGLGNTAHTVSIINAIGKICKTDIVSGTANRVDLTSLVPGTYFLQLTENSTGAVTTRPFVKQ